MPIAPRPITPRVLPLISGPAKALLPFSTSFGTVSPLPLSVLAHSIAGITFLDERKRPVSTSSLTALALAPGVLKTTIPASLHLSIGILLTPAPARAIVSVFASNSISCIDAERTRIASGFAISVAQVYWLLNRQRPVSEILLSVRILYIFSSPYEFAFSNSAINSTSFSTPSTGIAL